MGNMTRDWSWLQSHSAVLLLAAAVCLVPIVIAAIWHAGRKGSLAKALRSVAIPLVLLWEAQGLYLVALRVRVPHDLAYVLAGVTCAVVLTFAAYAHDHHKKHATLGPNGRMMWYVAVPMGLIVAANSRSLAETGLRVVLPLLSVAAFRAAYVPDEPGGRRQAQGSWRLTPRRLGVALGLLDPADTDLLTVHAERAVRMLTRHAAGYHRGARMLRGWHGHRFERLALMADDTMIEESARRVHRVHTGLASTAPGKHDDSPQARLEPVLETAPEHAPELASGVPGSEPEASPETRAQARSQARSQDSPEPALKLAASKSSGMTPDELAPHVAAMLRVHGDAAVSQARIKKDLHVGTDKAREALRIAKRDRTVVPLGTRRTSGE